MHVIMIFMFYILLLNIGNYTYLVYFLLNALLIIPCVAHLIVWHFLSRMQIIFEIWIGRTFSNFYLAFSLARFVFLDA